MRKFVSYLILFWCRIYESYELDDVKNSRCCGRFKDGGELGGDTVHYYHLVVIIPVTCWLLLTLYELHGSQLVFSEEWARTHRRSCSYLSDKELKVLTSLFFLKLRLLRDRIRVFKAWWANNHVGGVYVISIYRLHDLKVIYTVYNNTKSAWAQFLPVNIKMKHIRGAYKKLLIYIMYYQAIILLHM